MRETLCLIHDAYKLHGTLQLKALYSDYKYRYAQSIKKTKINANNNFIRDHQNNSKAMWSLINRNKQRTIQETTDLSPNQFNFFFSNVANNLVNSLPLSSVDPIKIVSSKSATSVSFSLDAVSEVQIRDIVNKLKNKRSKFKCGSD